MADWTRIYLLSKAEDLEMFDAALRGVLCENDSGKILGMSYREFSAQCVFSQLKEQEAYMSGICKDILNIDARREKEIYVMMRRKAEEVFGEQFHAWYKFSKQDHELPMYDSEGKECIK